MPHSILPPSHRALYTAFVEHGLTRWLARLPDQLALGLDRKRYGDLPGWESAVAKLPTLSTHRAVYLDRSAVTVEADLTPGDHARASSLLRSLMPWRKGPYTLCGTHIDTEWRSDLKWERLKPHIRPLLGKRVLDVGGGNGYHGWRMAGEGASFVLVIDPSPRFFYQFQAVKHFIGDHPQGRRVHLLPIGIEVVPARLAWFDTVFSMGVFYHRQDPLGHLAQLFAALKPGGELVLETLVVEGDEHTVLVPGERYAQMPNVYFLPSASALCHWLSRCGFEACRAVDDTVTTREEQRRTDWMTFQSLDDFLDPLNPSLTVEGYPAPRRAVIIARRPPR